MAKIKRTGNRFARRKRNMNIPNIEVTAPDTVTKQEFFTYINMVRESAQELYDGVEDARKIADIKNAVQAHALLLGARPQEEEPVESDDSPAGESTKSEGVESK